jgi:hypothetical protein
MQHPAPHLLCDGINIPRCKRLALSKSGSAVGDSFKYAVDDAPVEVEMLIERCTKMMRKTIGA